MVLTHAADAGLTLKTATTSDDTKATLTLQTGDTDIAANDVLGQLHFQAPDEGAGTDAILVAAGIAAISEGDFSASNNATKLSFQTGASEAASEKMSLSSAGLLTIADDLIIGDGKTIGSASDPDAMSIAAGGAVTFTQTPVFPDGSLALADLDIDGGTDIGADIVDADLFIIDDGAGGTNRKTAASRLKTYIGSGLSNAQQWRITSSFNFQTLQDIDTAWEESDSTGYARIGDALTQSSGIFTFPTTGIWMITAMAGFRANAGNRGVSLGVRVTTNNSSYVLVSASEVSNSDFGGSNNTAYSAEGVTAIIDVTNTTNVKFKLTVQATADTQTCDGDTATNLTGFTALRIGDT